MKIWHLLRGHVGKGTNKLEGGGGGTAACTFYVLVNEHVALGGQKGTKV